MTFEIPQHIQWELTAIIDDLKNTVEQKAAKAYLTHIFNVESLKSELEVKLCNDSWMNYINEDCMTVVSDFLYFTPFLLYKKIEEPFLQLMKSQIEADSCCSALLPHITTSASSEKGTFVTFHKPCLKSNKHFKKKRFKYSTLTWHLLRCL